MKTEKNQYRNTIFPSRDSIMKKAPANSKQIQLYSNHFKLKNHSLQSFSEWYMKIFLKQSPEGENQMEIYKGNPSAVKNEIQPDARQTIMSIFGANRKAIEEKLGSVLISGQHIFSFQKKSKEEFLAFGEHKEYGLGLEKKNENVPFTQLIANQEQRKPVLRFLNIMIKHTLK